MEIKYQIDYLEDVVEEHIPNLPVTVKRIIQRAIEERLMIDPVRLGKPLRYSLKGHRRLRVGDYRVVYRAHQDLPVVTIVAIKHRKDIYE